MTTWEKPADFTAPAPESGIPEPCRRRGDVSATVSQQCALLENTLFEFEKQCVDERRDLERDLLPFRSLFSDQLFPTEAAMRSHMRAVNCFSLTVCALSALPPRELPALPPRACGIQSAKCIRLCRS